MAHKNAVVAVLSPTQLTVECHACGLKHGWMLSGDHDEIRHILLLLTERVMAEPCKPEAS